MCIIINVPEGRPLPLDSTLHHCWEQNPHNGGLMFSMYDKVHIWKCDNKDEFIQGVREIHRDVNKFSPLIIHMRYATHGDIDLKNTHPFTISDTLAVAHNGTISHCAPGKESKKSDTRVFVNKILKKLPAELLENGGVTALLSEYIKHSRLVFLNGQGKVRIVNEHFGEWLNGVWYSNDWYKKFRRSADEEFYNRTFGGYCGFSGYDESWRKRMEDAANPPKKTGGDVVVFEDPNVCQCCGVKHPPGHLRSLVVKVEPGRYHKSRLCNDCFSAVYMTKNLTMSFRRRSIKKINNMYICEVCGAEKHEDILTEVFDLEEEKIYGYCGQCAYQLQRGTVTEGPADWFLDDEGIDIVKIYAHEGFVDNRKLFHKVRTVR